MPLFLIYIVNSLGFDFTLDIHYYYEGSGFPGPVLQTASYYFPLLYEKLKTTSRY
jgi:hypothetical protein